MVNISERFYNSYVSKRTEVIAPQTLEGLKPRLPYLLKIIKRHFPNDRKAKIIDLGCGHGALIHLARQLGYRNISGFDISPEQVNAAKKFNIVGVEKSDVMEVLVSVPDENIDCIIAFDLIEHFKPTELNRLIKAMHRVLRRGCRLIIHTPNAESPFGMRMRYGDITHEFAFTRASLSQLLLSYGFSRVDCYEDQPVPHGVKSAVRLVLWKGIRSFLRIYLAIETGDTGRYAIFSQNFLAVALK